MSNCTLTIGTGSVPGTNTDNITSPIALTLNAPKERSTVLVFAGDLLPISQTFVKDHVVHIKQFETILVGTRRVEGLALDQVETFMLPRSKLQRAALFFLGISPFLDTLIRQRHVRLIHAHFATSGMRIARYARRRRIPLLVTLHGSDVLRERARWTPRGVLDSFLWREMLHTTRLFLPVSKFLAAAAVASHFPRDRVYMHYLGIPLAEPHDRAPAHAAQKRPPAILFVGRQVEKKGLSLLIRACKILSDRKLSYTLTIIGDGPLDRENRYLCETLGVPVQFLGSLSPAEVRQEMERASIFCMPSTRAADGDNEGLGLAYLEAQAAGLPVVGFEQGPVPEAVINGITGHLVPDKSVEALAEALGRLLSDAGARERLGAAGRAFVHEQFDIQQRSAELDHIYLYVLSERCV